MIFHTTALTRTEQPPTHPEQDASNPEAPSSCSGWCLWGSISIAIIVIFTIIAISAHYFGYVDIRCYQRF
ncbi:hypothetical protein PoB_007669300, partial [Plakobranchus ocellatus]